MEGTPEEGMNELRVVAPDVKGELFIDHLIPASKVDARQQAADVQVPLCTRYNESLAGDLSAFVVEIRPAFGTGV